MNKDLFEYKYAQMTLVKELGIIRINVSKFLCNTFLKY